RVDVGLLGHLTGQLDGAGGRNLDRRRHQAGAGKALPDLHRVAAGGNILDGEAAVRAGDGEQARGGDDEIGDHLLVNVAEDLGHAGSVEAARLARAAAESSQVEVGDRRVGKDVV